MDIIPIKQHMEKAVVYLENEFKGLQVGRATPSLIENIDVEASYGI
jgi:ribosome recycling factor